MDLYLKVRRSHFEEGLSGRRIAREFGISRDSVSKMLSYSEPPGYRRTAPIKRPKLDAYVGQIDEWLCEDRLLPRKQRHTAKRVFERLRDECGFDGGYTIIKDYVRASKRGSREMFVPLSHPAGVIGDRYGRPGKGNDKGKVEGLVGYARRNFMVPLPRFADWEAFNDYLEEQCRKRQSDTLRGHKASIGERLESDLAAMRSLPGAPFEACDLQSGQVTSTSLVRYRGNDYSVPVAYGHREVWIKGFVDRVVIGCATEVIAEHPRSYDTADMLFDPIHYLPLIERKIMAFDQAAPLQGWELPKAFVTLQRLLEARQGKAGKREYVQVLRLLERFEMEALHLAIKDALQMRAVSFDAVKHLLLCRIERRPPRLDLDVYPFLPGTNVATTSAVAYMSLLAGGEA